MHRTERFGVGKKIDDLLLELLELLRQSEYTAPEPKILLLEKVALVIDGLRFFLQLSWDADLIQDMPYANLGQMIEEIGRMAGGWKRGLIAKTSPPMHKAGQER